MCERLKDKVAIVVGAGCPPGDTMGNGRATAILFARGGDRVMLVDYRLDSLDHASPMREKPAFLATTSKHILPSQPMGDKFSFSRGDYSGIMVP